MQIGNRSGMVSGSKIPYVTDGLIAMWDGEWNAGKGKHDDSATKWKDLIGDRDMTVGSTFRWGPNYIRNLGFSQCSTAVNKHIPADQFRTLEVVMRQEMRSARNQGVMHIFFDNYGGTAETGKGMGWYANNVRMFRTIGNSHSISQSGDSFGTVRTLALAYGEGMTTVYSARNGVMMTTTQASAAREYGTSKLLTLGTTYYPVMGRVYCVRVYSRVLTEAEIADNHAIDSARFGAGANNQYWSLDDPEGYITTQLGDLSGQVQNNTLLTSVSLPNATSAGGSSFSGCTNLKSVSLPSIKTISAANVFLNCSKLESLSLTSLTGITGANVFQACAGIKNVSLPVCSSLGDSCFRNCTKLESLDAPALSSIASSSLNTCTNLERINSQHSGMCVFRDSGCTVGAWCFSIGSAAGGGKLRVFVNVANSGVGGFANNPWQYRTVRAIKLLATDPPCYTATQLTLTTPITSTCRFYVPDEAVDTYKAHAAYASRASYIYPASEFNESDWWVD